jgi:hypothetical protein
MGSGQLYVFVHGLAVIRDNPALNNVEVVLPDVPGHTAKAGGWLAECPVQRQELNLAGVRSGPTPVAQLLQYTIDLRGCSLAPRGRAVTLRLPRPSLVMELLRVEKPGVVATNDGKKAFSRYATAPVLVYDYADENLVALEGHPWEPCAVGAAAGGAISLHIFSTSERPEGAAHVFEMSRALETLVQGFPGLTFARPVPPPPPWHFPAAQVLSQQTQYGDLARYGYEAAMIGSQTVIRKQANGPFAFVAAELESLVSRTERLGRLARKTQQGRGPVDLAEFGEVLPLGGPAGECDYLIQTD